MDNSHGRIFSIILIITEATYLKIFTKIAKLHVYTSVQASGAFNVQIKRAAKSLVDKLLKFWHGWWPKI